MIQNNPNKNLNKKFENFSIYLQVLVIPLHQSVDTYHRSYILIKFKH